MITTHPLITTVSCGYWDFPLKLVAIGWLEYGIGPNLAVRALQRYKLGYDDPGERMPGRCCSIAAGIRGKHAPRVQKTLSWAVVHAFSLRSLSPFHNPIPYPNPVPKRFLSLLQIRRYCRSRTSAGGFRDYSSPAKILQTGSSFSRMAV